MAADEKIDLDEVRMQEINALDAKVTAANLFEFLGLPAGAAPDDVRTAFRDASRKFHPDKYYGKNLGPFRQKLDRIFKRLVEANQTLSDPDKREAYLAANPFVRAAVRSSGNFPALKVEPKTETEEARDAERRSRLAKHPYLAKATKLQEFLSKAKGHVEKQEYSQAFTHLNNATQVDPNNAEVKALLIDVRKRADLARSDTSYQHALEALNRGDEDLAKQALRTAVNANPNNHKAAAKAATLFEKQGSDMREAVNFAQKAVDAAPSSVEYRMLLARLMAEAGMKALAKKHFEEAARLNPEHPEVKKHGKKLWPF